MIFLIIFREMQFDLPGVDLSSVFYVQLVNVVVLHLIPVDYLSRQRCSSNDCDQTKVTLAGG